MLARYLIGAVLVLSPMLLQAQEADSSRKPAKLPFYHHAIQFQISQDFSLRDFQGALLSYKYHFTHRLAIRLGAGISARGYAESETDTGWPTDSSYLFIETDKTFRDMTLAAQFVYDLKPSDRIHFYLGTGPVLSYRLDQSERVKLDTLNAYGSWTRLIKTTNTGIGLMAVYGVEWFFRKDMSLLGEYGFQWIYFRDRLEQSGNYNRPHADTESERKGWHVSSLPVKFGLSVYF